MCPLPMSCHMQMTLVEGWPQYRLLSFLPVVVLQEGTGGQIFQGRQRASDSPSQQQRYDALKAHSSQFPEAGAQDQLVNIHDTPLAVVSCGPRLHASPPLSSSLINEQY